MSALYFDNTIVVYEDVVATKTLNIVENFKEFFNDFFSIEINYTKTDIQEVLDELIEEWNSLSTEDL
jgi:hypothetical protein